MTIDRVDDSAEVKPSSGPTDTDTTQMTGEWSKAGTNRGTERVWDARASVAVRSPCLKNKAWS